mmetsp:Transcript_6055/g.10817  ORF Transcript_6055/g.10817 Transcript_6055/m.10817 type:complete len:123 (+) Transcript_6055:117-485(+)|eukprot:CAMPEP_0201879480 /NCGR_PEP_ID=MMETSP0902-20130614/10345_1 /ASSEMBLY_ACC=CAM_ASM_000551 /TAXON_ID=420261 /ORGANISM="Thalassiosira antarctica, Strain CCMP982" /LENGTH=122 /DNA_ID=CAMNT_0048407307 /DNA_START=46 /DNA_END=414 /DNA_ORIENTATION=-
MSQTQTMTEPAPQNQSKKPFLFSLSAKNETAFKIKQLATGAHFISLMTLGFLYLADHAQTFNCFVFSAVSFVLAIFIPPTGMIKPNDAPEYAKNSMSYIPEKEVLVPVVPSKQNSKKNKKQK